MPTAASEHRQPTIVELTRTSIPLLDATVEEIFRLAPTLPIVNRETVHDGSLVLGHPLPKGTNIFFISNGPSYVMPAFQIDESLRSADVKAGNAATRFGAWRNEGVEAFVPERWLRLPGQDGRTLMEMGGDEVDVTDPACVVFDATAGPLGGFGHGPRGCFGRRLAYLEMRLLLALLVWNFEFDEVPAELGSYAPRESMTTHPKFCYVRLRKVEV